MHKLFFTAVLLAALPVQAALVDNGSYTTDSNNGLDWLDLSATYNMTVSDADSANSGWRLATNAEVENLFNQLFDGFFDNTGDGTSETHAGATYSDQIEDVANFHSLFGSDTRFRNGLGIVTSSFGRYLDEDGIFQIMGAGDLVDLGWTNVVGMEYSRSSADPLSISPDYGTFLVKSSIVPIPAAVWLFGSALAGLGWIRRKQTI